MLTLLENSSSPSFLWFNYHPCVPILLLFNYLPWYNCQHLILVFLPSTTILLHYQPLVSVLFTLQLCNLVQLSALVRVRLLTLVQLSAFGSSSSTYLGTIIGLGSCSPTYIDTIIGLASCSSTYLGTIISLWFKFFYLTTQF